RGHLDLELLRRDRERVRLRALLVERDRERTRLRVDRLDVEAVGVLGVDVDLAVDGGLRRARTAATAAAGRQYQRRGDQHGDDTAVRAGQGGLQRHACGRGTPSAPRGPYPWTGAPLGIGCDAGGSTRRHGPGRECADGAPVACAGWPTATTRSTRSG